jgi:hypothetical protein
LMHPIFVDLREDLAGAAREAVMLDAARERVAGAFPHADVVDRWIMVNAIASGIEKVYSGVERALTRVVRSADRHVPDGPEWHADLLRRLSVDVPGRRPAVISDETRHRLDGLRSFRHRERNTYVHELDPARVLEIAGNVMPALKAVNDDVARLEQHWNPGGPPAP